MTTNTCPRPDKVGYDSKTDALAAWRALRTRSNAKRHRNLVPYRCDCGTWHLGNRNNKPKRPQP